MENAYNQALERLRQEGQHEFKGSLRNREFETSQGYMARPCLKEKKKEERKKDLLLLKVLKDITGITDKT